MYGLYEIECTYGVRYSVLAELDYIDLPRMCIVDPMHNLFLGTGKHVLELWKRKEIISNKQFDNIQEIVDSFITPAQK